MSRSKIIMFGIATVVIVGAYIYANAVNHWSWSSVVSAATFKTVPTKKYSIETPGINPRVYEFDTTDGMHCVALLRDSTDTSPALQCYRPLSLTKAK